MKKACEKWRDQLLEAALAGVTAKGLDEHLRACANCSEELSDLRARKARLDALLPLAAQGVGPSPDFRARVLAEAQAASAGKRAPWRVWTLAGVTAVILVALVIGVTSYRKTARTVPADELAAAQTLAEWRAPSDVLLANPGQEFLRKMPRLGESYLRVPVKMPLEDE
jgi:predicted anti-sigma-YlaC factor YlaD